MERKVFRSRVSVLLIIFISIIMLPGLIPTIRSGNIFNPGFYTIIGVIIFIVLPLSGIKYEITDQKLLIKTWGFSSGSCPISQILSVERSYNLLSSPAGSLKRLCIRFKKGYKWPYILVSPVREQEFLDGLKKINPDIYIRVGHKKAWYRIWDWDI